MHMEEEQRQHPLEQGQTWKLEHGYLHIVELVTRLVYYRVLRHLNQAAVTTSLIGVVELLIYLKHNEAELVNEQNRLVIV
jgi:hypothetical protein